MREYRLKNRAVFKWFGDEVEKLIKKGAEFGEKQTSERILRRVLAKAPVSRYGMSFKRSLAIRRGEFKPKPKSFRLPGTLKSSIRRYKSKFENGGYIVMAGSKVAWYANIVEWGTTTRRQKTTGRFTGRQRKGSRYLRQAIAYEKRQMINQIRQQMSMLRWMNN